MAANNLGRHLQGMGEQQAIATLQKEGRRLQYIALKVWRKYLSSYKPKEYIRTRNTQRGIKLGRVQRVNAFEYGIRLTFENDLMYHDSIFNEGSSKYPQGHSLMLISDGWHSEKLERRIGKVERLTYFEGIDYIGQVKKSYEAGAPVGVRLDVEWSGNYLKK